MLKKGLLLLIIATTASLQFSCKRKYKCVCNSIAAPEYQGYTVDYGRTHKFSANLKCQETDVSMKMIEMDINCAVKKY